MVRRGEKAGKAGRERGEGKGSADGRRRYAGVHSSPGWRDAPGFFGRFGPWHITSRDELSRRRSGQGRPVRSECFGSREEEDRTLFQLGAAPLGVLVGVVLWSGWLVDQGKSGIVSLY